MTNNSIKCFTCLQPTFVTQFILCSAQRTSFRFRLKGACVSNECKVEFKFLNLFIKQLLKYLQDTDDI